MKWKHWIKLIIWIVAFEAIGFLLGLLTDSNLYPWYEGLQKSNLTPPGAIFSIVWSILYAILAMVGWRLADRRNVDNFKQIFNLYLLQMIMNWAWTPIFFQFKWIGLSFLCLILIVLLNGIIIVKSLKHDKLIAALLLPYLLWLFFATYLNGVIWFLN